MNGDVGAERDNRAALLGLIAASAFGVGLLARALERIGATVQPWLMLALALVIPPLLYVRIRRERAERAAPAAPLPLTAGAGAIEEESNAGL